MQAAIEVQGLGKRFRRYRANRPATLQEAVVRGLRGVRPEKAFWALQDISFRALPGQMVGVIGPNGAGKSTLLRLVGDVIKPDAGKVAVHGRIGALIDLGAGFHPDLTGRENVFINGIISGLTRREVAGQFDSIVAFAELEDFIDNPIRTYSTGMQMRLAFSVAVHSDPQVLLIDEVLAVGDMAFQVKCLDRIAAFKARGCAILLVSHDTGLVERMCDEALWLRAGRLAGYGPAGVVVRQYTAEMKAETERRTPKSLPVRRTSSGYELRPNQNRFGSLEMEILDVRLCAPGGTPVVALESGGPLRVEIEYRAPQPVDSPIFGLSIINGEGMMCYDTSTAAAGLALPVMQGKGIVALDFERLDLMGGEYFLDVGIYKSDWSYAYDYHWHVYPIKVESRPGEKGVLKPPVRWRLNGR